MRANLLRFKLACAFDSAGMNAEGAGTGPPMPDDSVFSHLLRLSLYVVHICPQGHLRSKLSSASKKQNHSFEVPKVSEPGNNIQ